MGRQGTAADERVPLTLDRLIGTAALLWWLDNYMQSGRHRAGQRSLAVQVKEERDAVNEGMWRASLLIFYERTDNFNQIYSTMTFFSISNCDNIIINVQKIIFILCLNKREETKLHTEWFMQHTDNSAGLRHGVNIGAVGDWVIYSEGKRTWHLDPLQILRHWERESERVVLSGEALQLRNRMGRKPQT